MSAAQVYSVEDEAAQIAKALHGKKTPDGWMARCPSHEDHTPSLSIKGKDGKTLLHCFAGCSQRDVIDALKEQGLWGSRPALNGSAPSKIYYVYKDEQGRELHRTVRTPDKKFKREHWENGQWISGAGDRKVLYHLDELLARREETICKAEGEKDVDRLRSLGFLCTCNPYGADGWNDGYSASIEKRDVVIFYDNDTAGQNHAQKVAVSLLNAGCRVRIVDLPEGKDVSDFLDLGHTKADLEELIANAPYLNKKGVKVWRDGFKSKADAPTISALAEEPAGEPAEKPHGESNVSPPELPLTADTFHDHGNAQKLRALSGEDLRYCHAMKNWLVWDGKRWQADATGQARRKAKLAMSEFYRQALAADLEKAQKFALASLDDKRITSLLRMAESDIYVEPHQLDTHPYLVNFQNGTFDVSTGKLREHRRADFLTKLILYDYQPEASSALWLSFLSRFMGGGPEASECDIERSERLMNYLQRALGYSLTGDVREKAVFMCYGKGNNGKSTMLSTVCSLAEEYTELLNIDTLMVRQENNNSQADLARLRGARFVQTSETEEGQRLAEGKLKRITQGMPDGKITATRKYENPIQFTETHKLWMDCNHRPVIRGTENAIWNRLHMIPFTVRIPDDDIDTKFPGKLKQEAEGILAWLMAGAVAWYQDGLKRPQEMQTASTEYRSEMDPLKDFLEERCIQGDSFSAKSSRIYC